MNDQLQWIMESPIGKLYLVASPRGLRNVIWARQAIPLAPSLKSRDPAVKILAQAAKELSEYFSGRRTTFSVDLELEGTPFQRKVWGQLAKIPFGTTCSYSDVAQKIRQPKAVRAVGTANGRNPISIIIPCHRVIAANQTLGGYAGGLNIKQVLLNLENKESMGRYPVSPKTRSKMS